MLRQIMAFGQSREQRDVLLLGGLTTLGASLAQTLRFLYGGKWFFSSLQTFVVAPPASGKGVLAWTRMLVQPIHDEIRATVAEEMKRYKKEMTSFNSLGREKAKARSRKCLSTVCYILRQQHRYRYLAEYHRLGRRGDHLRDRGGHGQQLHRLGLWPLERGDPLLVRSRPAQLQPADRPGVSGVVALPPVGIDKRNARAGEAADPFQRERIVLPANVLLYAPCTSLDQPVQSTADRHVAGVPEIGQG